MRLPKRGAISPYYLLVPLVMACTALVEYAKGRHPFCSCGTIKLWYGVIHGPENSQQFTDWYSFSHIIHGFLLYGLFWLLSRRVKPLARLDLRLLLAAMLECGWEMLENSNFIIERYRAATISLDYYGDSILNSMGDISSMMLGFMLASKLPLRRVIALAVFMELAVGYLIHDNLTLNIIMLVHPMQGVRAWQDGQF